MFPKGDSVKKIFFHGKFVPAVQGLRAEKGM